MKSVVIINKKVSSKDIKYINEFNLENRNIYVGLIDTQDVLFDKNDRENDNKVFVRIKAFSCNYRDKGIILNVLDRFKKQGGNYLLYSCIGSDFVGEVMEVGRNVKNFQIGDRVIPNASYPYSGDTRVLPGIPTNFASCEYQIFHASKLILIPSEMSDEIASGFTVTSHVAFGVLRRINIKKNCNILITGAKSNTSITIINLLNKLFNSINIFALTSSENNNNKLRKIGVKEIFIYKSDNEYLLNTFELNKIMRLTNGIDIVIDPFLDINFSKIVTIMKHYSQYITFGYAHQYGMIPFNEEKHNLIELFSPFLMKNISIYFQNLGLTADLMNAIEKFLNKKYDIFIDKTYTKNSIGDFFNRSFNDVNKFGKVIYKY